MRRAASQRSLQLTAYSYQLLRKSFYKSIPISGKLAAERSDLSRIVLVAAQRNSARAVLPRGVSPFGHPRIKGCSPPPRGVSPARHVLHRRPNPRHPPYALVSPSISISTFSIFKLPSILTRPISSPSESTGTSDNYKAAYLRGSFTPHAKFRRAKYYPQEPLFPQFLHNSPLL